MLHRSHDQGGFISMGLHPGWGGGSAFRGVGQTPEIHGILRDTVNKRAARILLECFLVSGISANFR